MGTELLVDSPTPRRPGPINVAIIDSINRDLEASGFVLDQKNTDFIIIYEAGGLSKSDVGPQPDLSLTDITNYSWGSLGGVSSDVWIYSLAKMKIAVTDAVTKRTVWQAVASQKIRDPTKFMDDLKENVDKYIQKTMKGFPPKK